MKQHTYTFATYNGRVKICIDGVLFLTFNQIDFKGIYAYKDDTNLYGIDIYLATTTMEVYFKTKQVWLDILQLLNTKL